MKAKLFNTTNQAVGEIELDDSIFGAVVRPHLFYEVVNMQMANRRAGTHKVKRVPEVSGTKKKPYKQKGTGRARHGTMRAVGMRKGGVAHGPEPRDHGYAMPKKKVQVALRSALSLRNGESKLMVVTGWKPAKPRTKDAEKVLAAFSANKALVVDSVANTSLAKSLSNLPYAKFLPVEALNVRDILAYDHLFVTELAVQEIERRLKTKPSRSEQAKLENAGTKAKRATKKTTEKRA